MLDTSGKIAAFYGREYYCFSNFSSFAVLWRGRLWMTSEHAYQAAKFFDTSTEFVEMIFYAKSAYSALKFAKALKHLRAKDWEERKLSIMEEVCRAKLQQHGYIQRKLLQTGLLEIVEDSPGDSFWGWGPDKNGRNELGKIWMKLRSELNETKICYHCNGVGRLKDFMSKSRFAVLDWLSFDGEICNLCGGTGKIPAKGA